MFQQFSKTLMAISLLAFVASSNTFAQDTQSETAPASPTVTTPPAETAPATPAAPTAAPTPAPAARPATTTVAPVSVPAIIAQCENIKAQSEQLQQRAAQTAPGSRIQVPRMDPFFDCARAVSSAYEEACKVLDCESYILNGAIFWAVGLEVNTPRLFRTHLDLRGMFGFGFLNTIESGTQRRDTRWSVLFQPSVGLSIEGAQQPNGLALPAASPLQLVIGGISLLYVPNDQMANLNPDDFYARPSTTSWRNNLLQAATQAQIGVHGEIRSPMQNDWMENTTIIGTLTTNARGLGSKVDSALLFSGYWMRGKIRYQSVGVTVSPIFELIAF